MLIEHRDLPGPFRQGGMVFPLIGVERQRGTGASLERHLRDLPAREVVGGDATTLVAEIPRHPGVGRG